LIAADGRDSFCRQAIGVGVDVHDYDQVAIVTLYKHQNRINMSDLSVLVHWVH
jgi:2-polyprenyl-6-methoxyphenol hydroxylase-like FAD-dependent oxidoreductase